MVEDVQPTMWVAALIDTMSVDSQRDDTFFLHDPSTISCSVHLKNFGGREGNYFRSGVQIVSNCYQFIWGKMALTQKSATCIITRIREIFIRMWKTPVSNFL